ncbi:nucleotidyltransferase family protein [Tenacibaculum crassostreae]|uniref:nucleotidyltransferase family protein n=1 Tax=Tenacibaculum crassostreae TaxID=502683 RepID=UPI003892FBE2
MQKTAILILAAGSSSRMGSIKQLLPYKNTTLLGWATQQAQQSIVKNIFCVLGANKAKIEEQIPKIEFIYNKNHKEGLSTSIVCGVQHLLQKGFDSILFMLADQPHVTFQYLNNLVETSKNHPHKIIASFYEDTIGVPAVFPKNYFNDLLNLTGDKGAKQLFIKNEADVIKIKPSENIIDIDTPDEYQNLINQ